MELFELISVLADISMAGLVAALFVFAWRSRDKGDERESELAASLVRLASDLSTNVQASTRAITDLKTCEDETQQMVAGMRRENTAIIGTLAHEGYGLAALEAKIDGLPKRTAGAVRADLRGDLEQIRNAAASMTLRIDSLVTKIDTLPVVADCDMYTSTPDSSEPKPETNDNAKQEATNDGKPSNVD